MRKAHFLASIIVFLFACGLKTAAQPELRWLKHQINNLASPSMDGRGYVEKGGEKAAGYLHRQFKEFGLRSFNADSSYFQQFSFSVNTFPGTVYLKLQKKDMDPGEDYIVHPASRKTAVERMKVSTINLKKVKDSASWLKVKAKLTGEKAYLMKYADTTAKYVHKTLRNFTRDLPRGLYIVPQHGKLIWSVATDTIAPVVFYVEDTVMPKRIKRLDARLDANFLPSYKSNNVVGFVPGTERPDSFIVFTAHFDHLGKMGRSTVFPGAHDNASGTALMLYMAQYFAKHPQKYSVAFIGFSGEEAGLLGSKYYANHPLFPLEKIKCVVNTDMTGDAKDGITVVNGTEQKEIFGLLQTINNSKNYLPKITERGQTQNSDHYPFSEKGVPAVFIYSNGTKGYYHDVFDKPKELSLENIDGLIKLLTDFVTGIQK